MTGTGDWIETSPGVNKNATTTLSDTENISVILETTTTSMESQVTGGSSSQVCINPPRYENEPYNPQIYQSVYHGYQDMLDYNLDSDDEMETVSIMVVDEAGNLVPVTTESEVPVQNELVSCDERGASQVVRQVEGRESCEIKWRGRGRRLTSVTEG